MQFRLRNSAIDLLYMNEHETVPQISFRNWDPNMQEEAQEVVQNSQRQALVSPTIVSSARQAKTVFPPDKVRRSHDTNANKNS